jgi:hypothetical protein
MPARRLLSLFLCAAIAPTAAAGAVPQASAPAAAEEPGSDGRFGIVRVRIDPAVGDVEAEIRQLLAARPFVTITEPADYMVTTQPDFPLDLALVDLRQQPELWGFFDQEPRFEEEPGPRQYAVGNLRSPETSARMAQLLVAASRVRALLDRSFHDTQGVEACLFVAGQEGNPQTCRPLGGKDVPRIVIAGDGTRLRITNRSDGDRWVTTLAADGSLGVGRFGYADSPPVWKLASGDAVEIAPEHAADASGAGPGGADPRVMVLVSSRPFAIDGLLQPSPLGRKVACGADWYTGPCDPVLSGITAGDDLAVRSFQLFVYPEPEPAMGHGSDVTARMAVWMAQFYSILPYSAAEIEADSRLPEEETQFLAFRSYEERQHRCGATLIAPNLVLTAAHCVAKGQYAGAGLSKLFTQRRVRLGTTRLGKGGASYGIAGVAVHAGYDPRRTNHDLALLLLRPDRGSGSIQQKPIAVADRPLPGNVNALGFGWGFTGAVSPNGNIMLAEGSRIQNNPDVLQYGEMVSVTLDTCRRKLAERVAPGMLCMYSRAALQDGLSAAGVFMCRGDSGGPLVRKAGERDVLVGVVSWSMGCGYKTYPSVFTDAGSYARWITAARAALRPGMAIRVADPDRPAANTAAR